MGRSCSRADLGMDDSRSRRRRCERFSSRSEHPRASPGRPKRWHDDAGERPPKRRSSSRGDDGVGRRSPPKRRSSSRGDDGVGRRSPPKRRSSSRGDDGVGRRSPPKRRSSRGDAGMDATSSGKTAVVSPKRDTREEEGTGWVPIPGKLHPSGLDEVEAMKYGLFPVRNRAPPLDEDGKTSDIFVCDKAAYQMLNDAHLRGTELGAWVAKRLRLGALFVHHNYDQVPGWRVITLFGRLKAMLPTRGKKVIPEWLKLHGQQDDAECVESAQLFAEAATDFDVDASCFRIVFVCGNTKFVELLRKDHAGLQQLFVERRAVDRTRDVPFRVWHITSQSCSQLEEECLDESLQDFAYQSGGWEYLRGIVRKYH